MTLDLETERKKDYSCQHVIRRRSEQGPLGVEKYARPEFRGAASAL
jgi:hypothetical protein